MNTRPRIARRLAGAAFALLLAAAATAAAPEAQVVVENPWSRATPPGTPVGVGYLTLRNPGAAPRRLVGAESPAAGRVEIHETRRTADGLSQMRPVEAVAIAAGATVRLEPGGLHLMLVELKSPLVAGTRVPVTLRFDAGAPVQVQLAVQPLTATGPPDPHAQHPQHGHHAH